MYVPPLKWLAMTSRPSCLITIQYYGYETNRTDDEYFKESMQEGAAGEKDR